MSLLEDKESKEAQLTIERFEKAFRQLLVAYSDCQKQIIALTDKNKELKELLALSKTNLSSTTKSNALGEHKNLLSDINKYIKEIDLCLAYFEQA